MKRLLLILVALLILGGLFLLLAPRPGNGPRDQTIEVEIEGSTMTPAEISVGEGDRVTLRVRSDHEVVAHIHGYDIEQEVAPGEPVEVSFDAGLAGQFEIEDELTHTPLGTLIVQPREGGAPVETQPAEHDEDHHEAEETETSSHRTLPSTAARGRG